MNYCIAYGENDAVIISLDRSGNTYTVSTWSRTEHRTVSVSHFDSCTWACKIFFAECRKHNVTPQKVDHSPSDFANVE